MLKQEHAMREMAKGYLRLAKSSLDPQDRKKFLDYAAVYAELSDRSVHPEEQEGTLSDWRGTQRAAG
jgi:hypothetical protein